MYAVVGFSPLITYTYAYNIHFIVLLQYLSRHRRHFKNIKLFKIWWIFPKNKNSDFNIIDYNGSLDLCEITQNYTLLLASTLQIFHKSINTMTKSSLKNLIWLFEIQLGSGSWLLTSSPGSPDSPACPLYDNRQHIVYLHICICKCIIILSHYRTHSFSFDASNTFVSLVTLNDSSCAFRYTILMKKHLTFPVGPSHSLRGSLQFGQTHLFTNWTSLSSCAWQR